MYSFNVHPDHIDITDFDGKTYVPSLDRKRLTLQLDVVKNLMADGVWRTLAQIEDITGAPQASISARLRDLRKERFGGYRVDRTRSPTLGTWWYRVTPGAA